MIDTNKCEYLILSPGSFSCQNPASYKCTHCPSSFCLIHGLQHQQDTKQEINYLLIYVEVSDVRIVGETPSNIQTFEMDIFLEAYVLSHLEKKSISNDVYYTKGCKFNPLRSYIVASEILHYNRITEV